jgi:hypothetical protein
MGFCVIEGSQPESVKSKMRCYQLKSGVNWQWALKAKRLKTNGSEIRAERMWLEYISGYRIFDVCGMLVVCHFGDLN